MTLATHQTIYESAAELSTHLDVHSSQQVCTSMLVAYKFPCQVRLEELREHKAKSEGSINRWQRRVNVLTDVISSEKQNVEKAHQCEVIYSQKFAEKHSPIKTTM